MSDDEEISESWDSEEGHEFANGNGETDDEFIEQINSSLIEGPTIFKKAQD